MSRVGIKIVVVSGSRSLLSLPSGHELVSSILCRELEGAKLVCHGGAIGPDSWADAAARSLGIARIVFSLTSGKPYAVNGTRKIDLPGADEYAYSEPDWKRRPLDRNIQMIKWAAQKKAEGADVRVFGFIDANSKTHGTEHTLRQATARGLTVVRHTIG